MCVAKWGPERGAPESDRGSGAHRPGMVPEPQAQGDTGLCWGRSSVRSAGLRKVRSHASACGGWGARGLEGCAPHKAPCGRAHITGTGRFRQRVLAGATEGEGAVIIFRRQLAEGGFFPAGPTALWAPAGGPGCVDSPGVQEERWRRDQGVPTEVGGEAAGRRARRREKAKADAGPQGTRCASWWGFGECWQDTRRAQRGNRERPSGVRTCVDVRVRAWMCASVLEFAQVHLLQALILGQAAK